MRNALRIKQWCETEISPVSWPLIAMRAQPEIISHKQISLLGIDDSTIFDSETVRIISQVVKESYGVVIPDNVLFGEPDTTKNKKSWISKLFNQ